MESDVAQLDGNLGVAAKDVLLWSWGDSQGERALQIGECQIRAGQRLAQTGQQTAETLLLHMATHASVKEQIATCHHGDGAHRSLALVGARRRESPRGGRQGKAGNQASGQPRSRKATLKKGFQHPLE